MRSTDEAARRESVWLERTLKKELDNSNFPTYFQTAIKLKNALRSSAPDTRKIVSIVSSDPMMSAKIVQQANTASNYPGAQVSDLATAIAPFA